MSADVSSTARTPAPEPARRVKKRWLIPGILLGLLAVGMAWVAIRGTWADAEVRNPTSAAEGPVAQLVQEPSGRKVVRSAMIVPYPIDRVWAVVTDYDHFDQIFPYLRGTRGQHDPDGRWHMTARAGWPGVLDWAIETHITHKTSPASGNAAQPEDMASWDEPGGELLVNRGSWDLRPAGTGETLIVYTLDIEVARFPNFMVRAALLDRVSNIMRAVADRLAASPAGKS